MIKVRRRWPLRNKEMYLVLTSSNPTAKPFYLDNKVLKKTTRKLTVRGWDAFFGELSRAWRMKVRRGNTIEGQQRQTVNEIIEWLRWLIGGQPFSRGRARAVEELMQHISWLVLLEGEKFRDKFLWMEKRLSMVAAMKWDAVAYLRRQFPRRTFDPDELYKLDRQTKAKVCRYLKRYPSYKGKLNLNNYLREVFRKPERRT